MKPTRDLRKRLRAIASVKGFTLIELMVAVSILAILAAIAIPIYSRYSDRTYRSEAMADLLDCAQTLERRASTTFDYLGAAVGGANAGVIDPAICTMTSTRYTYTVNGTAANFWLLATPDAGIDEGRPLSYNSVGQRGWDEANDGLNPANPDAADQSWEES